MESNSLKELYRNAYGAVWQDNQRYSIVLEWQGRRNTLKFPCYVSLLKLAEGVDVHRMLQANTPDLEILTPCGCDQLFVLDVSGVLALQDLLYGARFSLNLNSLLHAQLFRTHQYA